MNEFFPSTFNLSFFVLLPSLFLFMMDRVCFGRSRRCRNLRIALCATVAAAVTAVGGDEILRLLGLELRKIPSALLALAVLWGCGICLLLLIPCASEAGKDTSIPVWFLASAAALLSVLVLGMNLLLWGGLSLAWAYSGSERTVTVEGQTLVEVETEVDTPSSYEYHRYLGPLFMGRKALFYQTEPIDLSNPG